LALKPGGDAQNPVALAGVHLVIEEHVAFGVASIRK
jgi:hypothetical protein